MSKKAQRLSDAQRGEAPTIYQENQQAFEEAQWDRDPAKQYIRRFAWLSVIKNYAQRLFQAGVTRPLKYFTLPGYNASDIGLLWKNNLISKTDDGKLNVAICDQKHADTVANYLGTYGGVLDYSRESLINTLKAIRGSFREHFPFDVINLDICTSVIARRRRVDLEVIDMIFRLQRGQGFLLLLTTKPDTKASNILIESLVGNLENEERFSDAYRKKFGECEPKELWDKDMISFTQLILPKVIAKYGRENGYKTLEHFVAQYSRRDDDYRMICHSFEFEPIGRQLANRYEPRTNKVLESYTENMLFEYLSPTVRTNASKEYAEFIISLFDRDPTYVDAVLSKDPNLATELKTEADGLIGWWREGETI